MSIVNNFDDTIKGIKSLFSTADVDFSFSKSISDELDNDIDCLYEYYDALKSGVKDTDALSAHMQNASSHAKEYAKANNSASISIRRMVIDQKMHAVAMQAQDKSFKNVNSLIADYNNGCIGSGISQTAFTSAISTTNPMLAKYLESLNEANASLIGYIGFTIKATAATVAFNASVMVGMMAAFALIAAAARGVIDVVDGLITTSKELAEKADEVTSTYKTQQEELKKTKETLDDLLPQYQKLSKGVDSLGNNLILTVEEYEEYYSITNQIADLFPSMVQGYNDQGIAILKCRDDVDALTRAYEENVIAANNAALSNGNAVYKTFKKRQGNFDTRSNDINTDIRDSLYELINSENIGEVVKTLSGYELTGITRALIKNGATRNARESNADFIKRVIQEDRVLVQHIVSEFDQSVETETRKVRSLAEAYLTNALLSKNADGSKVYGQISDVSANIIKSITGNLDYAFFKQFYDEHEMYAVLRNLLNDFNNLSSKDQNDLEVYLGMRTKLNNGECTIDEYLAAASNARSVISAFDEDEQKLLTLSIGLDDQEVDNQYQKILKHLQSRGMEVQAAQEWISGLEKKDFDKVFSFAVEFDRDRMEYELEQFEKGGNVDLHVRPVIDSSELEKAGWGNVKEGIATVYSGTYSNEDETVFANFTPIIVDENGDFKGILSPTALQEYAEGVLNGTRIDSDKLQIGATFEGEDAVKQAEKAGERISAIHAQWFVDSENFNLDEYLEIVEEWNRSIGGAAPAQFESFVSGEEFQSGIKGHLETAKELLDLLEKVRSGEKIEFAELNDISPTLVGAENLEHAVLDLLDADYSTLSEFLEKQIEGVSWVSEEESEKWYAYRDALLSTYEVAEQSKPAFGSLDEAMSGVGDATELMTAVYSEMADKGKLSLETVQALEKQFGTDARHLYSFVDGKPVADFDAIQKYYLKGITDLKLDEEVQQYLIDAYTIDPSKLDFSKAHEALKKAIEVKDLAADTKEFDASDVSAFMEFFGADYEKYLIKNDLGEYIGANLDALREYAVGLLGDSEAVQKMFSENWDKMVADATEAKRQIDNALDKMGVASRVSAYLDNVGSGNFDYSDALKDAGELLKEMGEGYSLDDFFTENEDGSVTKHTQFLIDWFDEYIDKAVEAGEFTADTGEKIKQMAKQSNALKKLTTAMSKVANAADLMKSAQEEAAETGRNSIDTLIALYNEFGEEASSMINIDADGGILVDTEAIKQKMYGVIDALINVQPEIKQAMKDTLSLEYNKEQFESEVDQYVSDVQTLVEALESLRKGEDIDVYSLIKQFPKLRSETEDLDEAIVDLLDSMESDIVGKFGKQFGKLDAQEDINELLGFLDVVLKVGEVVGNTQFSIDIDAEVDSMQMLADAIKESTSATGLSAESVANLYKRYKKLKSFDPSKLFEKTTHGIHLNTTALRELEQEYESLTKGEIRDHLDDLIAEYNSLTREIDNYENVSAASDLYARRRDILAQIEDVSNLASQYNGLTSSFNAWEKAMSGPEEGDMYDSLAGSLDDIDEMYKKGEIGTNAFRSYVQLLTDEDISTLDPMEVKKIYEERNKTAKKYLKEDNANSGLLSFLNDVKKANSDWAKLNKDGSWELNFGIGDDKAIANALGLSEELVQIIMRKLSDHGFKINLDTDLTDLDLLQGKADEAAQKLKELGATKVDFDFNVTNVARLNEQIDEAKASIEWLKANGKKGEGGNIIGLNEAQTVLATLIAQKQSLEEPTIFKLDIANIDGALGSALRKLEEIKEKSNVLEIQAACDMDTSEAQAEIDAIKASFTAEENEVLVKLGIDPNASAEKIADQLVNMEPEVLVKAGLDEESVNALMAGKTEYDFKINIGSAKTDLDDIRKNAEQAEKRLKNLGKTDVDFSFDITNVKRLDEQIESARETLEQFKDEDGKINLSVEGAQEAQYILYALLMQKQALEQPTIFRLDLRNINGAAGSALRKLEQIKKLSDTVQLSLEADVNADTSKIDAEIASVKESFTAEELELLATLGIDPEASLKDLNMQLAEIKPEMLAEVGVDEETIDQLVRQLEGIDAEVTLGIDDKEIRGYQAPPKTGKVTYTATMESWNPPVKSGTVVYRAVMSKFSGGAGVDGTVHSHGAAFVNGTQRRGDWGAKSYGMALGGELGPELVVRDGKFFTIGAESAEFFQHRPNDIIFNAAQTQEIFEKGKITNAAPRGKAFSSGSGTITANGSVITKPSESSSSNKSDKDDEKEPKTIDWIEIAIDRIEQAIEHLASTASSTYRTLKKRLGATASEIEKVNDELRLQERAYDRYIQQANSVALSEGLKARIRDGAIDINEYDADTAELISEYQEWYEKAIDCKTAIDELHESLSSLYEEEFGMIATDFDNQLSLLEHDMATLENSLEAIELKGHLGGASLYEEMQAISYQQMKDGQKKVRELTESMNKAVQSGAIDIGSEAWYEMLATINETKEQIQESNLAMIEYGNSIRELEWNNFDYLLDRISQITEETEFLIDLFSDEKLHDERGNLTDEGMAVVGMYGVNYNTYLAQAKKYADEIKEVEKDLSKDPYDSALIERREELLDLQRHAISAAEDEKKAIADLVEEGFDIELEALKELIDKYKDSLSSAKDLYSYQKKVGEQSSEIAKLQKQLSAYSGDASEENRARIQKLQVSLEEAQDKLEESQYDQYIKDQTELLDDIYADYEEVLNERLDNVDALIADMIESVNVNSDDIASTIIQAGKDVGYYLTDGMKSILTGDGSMLAMYSKNFSSELTTLNDTVGRIQSYVAAMIGAGDKIAADTQIGTVQGFSDGGYVAELKKIAMRNGDDIVTVNTLKRGEAIFTPHDADLVARLIDKVPVMHSMLDTAKYMGNTASTPTQMNQNISQQFGDLHIEIDHVEDYNDLVTKMRDDPKFEKFIQSMTTDRLVGKSKLAKYKYQWK